MRHFQQLPDGQAAMLFHRLPAEFTRDSPPDRLAVALGATLYAPAIRPNLADDLARCHADGLMSLVCCLEDAIRDDEVDAAEVNLAYQLRRYADIAPDGPLLFIRVRTPDQVYRMAERLGDALRVVSGFVLPKFRPDESGRAGVQAVHDIAAATALPIYVMPVLEGVGDDVLARGFGHFEDSAAAGGRGNYALAAHRVTHGEPLRDMPSLRPGDEVVVETRDSVYTYELDTDPNDLVVGFRDVWVVAEDPENPDPRGANPVDDPRLITLTTCAELFHTDDRMVAFGHLVSSESKQPA